MVFDGKDMFILRKYALRLKNRIKDYNTQHPDEPMSDEYGKMEIPCCRIIKNGRSMKKITVYILLLLLLSSICSCLDDKNNYDYTPINELKGTISNIEKL